MLLWSVVTYNYYRYPKFRRYPKTSAAAAAVKPK